MWCTEVAEPGNSKAIRNGLCGEKHAVRDSKMVQQH